MTAHTVVTTVHTSGKQESPAIANESLVCRFWGWVGGSGGKLSGQSFRQTIRPVITNQESTEVRLFMSPCSVYDRWRSISLMALSLRVKYTAHTRN